MRFWTRLTAFAGLLLGTLSLVRVKSPRSSVLMLPKMVSASLSPFLTVLGFVTALFAGLYQLPLTLVAGLAAALLSGRYVWRVAKQKGDFTYVFGSEWERHIRPEQAHHMLKHHWTWRTPIVPEPRWEKDVAFWTVPGSERKLLCDIWRPPFGVLPSGLAFLYFHGSGWHLLDKDFGTRPLFRHLASQGHVVMDVAYRMCPETDFVGMVGDVWRAISWMKANAEVYGVDPRRIVIGGGSAGGHLALLAAYADKHPQLVPDDVKDLDTSVRGVISYYGPTDMRVYYRNVGKILGFEEKPQLQKHSVFSALREKTSTGLTSSMTPQISPNAKLDFASLTHVGMMQNLFGGKLDEVPEAYELGSPVCHVGPHCPPTLLLYGEHDSFVSAEAARTLYHVLREYDVQAMYVEFPQTEHAFDLVVLPRVAPAAQAALYHVERFLAVMASPEFEQKRVMVKPTGMVQ